MDEGRGAKRGERLSCYDTHTVGTSGSERTTGLMDLLL
jgi:hypothetical protein